MTIMLERLESSIEVGTASDGLRIPPPPVIQALGLDEEQAEPRFFSLDGQVRKDLLEERFRVSLREGPNPHWASPSIRDWFAEVAHPAEM